jgi:hypothetical protein
MSTHAMHRSGLVLGVAALLAATGLAGCGGTPTRGGGGAGATKTIGDIPDNQVFVAYAPPEAGYSLKVPLGWTPTNRPDGGVGFTDKLNTIIVRAVRSNDAPDEASARNDLVRVRSTARGFSGGEVSTVIRPAGRVVLLTYRADAPADAVTGKVVNDDVQRYDYFHDGLRVTVTLTGPHGADNVDPWRTVTDSVRFTR